MMWTGLTSDMIVVGSLVYDCRDVERYEIDRGCLTLYIPVS